eukprot:GHVU01083360.1.p1 GENE.GHVU01083360.1~~GHVU01083360.1.p1  ORF type:complete len:1018 (+),score=142.92 GHVU01083360.1:978-4031(+)
MGGGKSFISTVLFVSSLVATGHSEAIKQYEQECVNADFGSGYDAMMKWIREYQSTSNSAGNPWNGHPAPVPVLDRLSRVAWYHVLSHQDAANSDNCDISATATASCHGRVNRAVQARTPTLFRHDNGTTQFYVNATSDTGSAFNAKAWVDKVSGFTADGTPGNEPQVVTVWGSGEALAASNIDSLFSIDCGGAADCTTGDSAGHQNKAALVSERYSGFNALGVYAFGRAAVIYFARLVDLADLQTETQCLPLLARPYNLRCSVDARYYDRGPALHHVGLRDPDQTLSATLFAHAMRRLTEQNPAAATRELVQAPETVGALAYYRAHSLDASDGCYKEVCDSRARWMNVRDMKHCGTVPGNSPAQTGTVMCPPQSGGADELSHVLRGSHAKTLDGVALMLGVHGAGSESASPRCYEWTVGKLYDGRASGLNEDDLGRLFDAAISRQDDDDGIAFRSSAFKTAGAWVRGRYGVFVACEAEQPLDGSWGLCNYGNVPRYEEFCVRDRVNGPLEVLRSAVRHYQAANANAAASTSLESVAKLISPFTRPRVVPVLDRLSRSAYYHAMTHASAADAFDHLNTKCASTWGPGWSSCHDKGVVAIESTDSTTFTHDNGTTTFVINSPEDTGASFDSKAWVEKTSGYTSDGVDKPHVVAIWADGIAFTNTSITSIFEKDCSSLACKGAAAGHQNKEYLVAQETRDYNALGMYIYGRLAVVYFAKLTNIRDHSTEVHCDSIAETFAFNLRCSPESRYDSTTSIPSKDPKQPISFELLGQAMRKLVKENTRVSWASLRTPEAVGAIAFYRAIGLSQMDSCFNSVCSNTAKWSSIRGVHSCESEGWGPPQQEMMPVTVTCPNATAGALSDSLYDSYKKDLNGNALSLGVHAVGSPALPPHCKEWVVGKPFGFGHSGSSMMNLQPQEISTLLDYVVGTGDLDWSTTRFQSAGAWVDGRYGVFVACEEADERGTWGECPKPSEDAGGPGRHETCYTASAAYVSTRTAAATAAVVSLLLDMISLAIAALRD